MTKQQIIDYVLETPHNTNPAILGQMIDEIGGSSGGSWAVLTEESVTTSTQAEGFLGVLTYSQLIDAETIRVTFNGTEYECERINLGTSQYAYGGLGQTGPDFSEYPFLIGSTPDDVGAFTQIYTESAGTYNIKIEAPQSGGGSSDFSTATMTLNTNTECEITAPIYNGSFIMSKYVFRTSAEVPVVLAPQGTIITINTSGTISVSGDIQIAGEGYGITGDCTITISDGK